MRRKKLFRTPYLYDAGGDLSKAWWIELGYRDPRDGKMKRKRYQEGFAELRTKKERYRLADDLIKNYTAKLTRGWIPPNDVKNQVVYEDELEYHVAAQVYGRKRKANKNIRFYASEYTARVKSTKAKKTYESYRGKIREFITWLERERLVDNDLSTFDNSLILRFFDYLIDEHQLARRTVEKYKLTYEKVHREALTEQEIERIQQLKWEDERLEKVRDLFLFCIYTGLAFVDVQNLKMDHLYRNNNGDWWIKNNRHKTSAEFLIPL